jgi:aerobic carbon-monoxide dehydrogenase medium subunit
MKPPPFDYLAPATAEEAVALLDGDTKILGGGQSLIPLLALRMSDVPALVDVSRVPGLSGVERRGETVHIGGTTTYRALGRDPVVAAAAPLVARAVPLIGHDAIRSRGTLGGSVAHADPAAELPAVALALDAAVETLSPSGRRTLPAADLFTGVWTTVLEPDELVTGLTFPVWPEASGFAIEEFARRHGDFAIAGAAVAVTAGRCAIALFGMGSTPVRAQVAEKAAVEGAPAAEVGRLATEGLSGVPTDAHGSAAYRRRVGAALVEKAVARAREEAHV